MTRWTRFVQVGAMGFGAQLVVLYLTTAIAHLPQTLAIVLAVEAAIFHNFVWHERWTWRDRIATTCLKARVERFLKFNLASGVISLLGNVVLTMILVERTSLPLLPANITAIGCLSLVNFLVADRLTFRLPLEARC